MKGLAIAACLWVLSDSMLGLENSWLLYLIRALAPLLLVFTLGASITIGIRSALKGACLSRHLQLAVALSIATCCAPIIRSLIRASPFSPSTSLASPSNTEQIRLLNFNILGFRDLSTQVIGEINRTQPDIVTLQEVTQEVAHKLRDALSSSYPCQILDPAEGSWGMGTLAKHPCTPISFNTTGSWVGKPQMTRIVINNRPIIAANIHAIHPHAYLAPHPHYGAIRGLSNTVRRREESIGELLDAIKGTTTQDVIIAGDLNSTMRNTVYELIRAAGYHDSWLEKHSFLSGGTWPSAAFTRIGFIAALLRIDFVFYSSTLAITTASQLPDSLGSDHRGLVVEFSL